MKLTFGRKTLDFIGFLTCLSLCCCSTLDVKTAPEHIGVDDQLKPLVNEYKDLAKNHGIIFKNEVTVGFKRLDEDTIGQTTYGFRGWREIDIDPEYWSRASKTGKLVLMFHELTHAYCDRDHDFGSGKKYANSFYSRRYESNKDEGFYETSGCPISIMYPRNLDDECVLTYYNDYINEMFQRCVPW